MDKEQFSQLAPRGTIRRFASAGAINTLLFWIFWEVLRLSPALELLSETGIWATAWVMSCTIAHFTHRYFTFDGRKDVKTTMLGAFGVYAVDLLNQKKSNENYETYTPPRELDNFAPLARCESINASMSCKSSLLICVAAT